MSENKNTIRWRRWKEKKFKTKEDYQNYLRDMRENVKKRK